MEAIFYLKPSRFNDGSSDTLSPAIGLNSNYCQVLFNLSFQRNY